MPILNCLIAPDASWQAIVDACNEYGVECVFFHGSGRPLRQPPKKANYAGCLRVFYTEDVRALRIRGYLRKMEESPSFNYLVIIGAPPNRFSNLHTYEGPIRSLVAHHFEISVVDESIDVDFSEYDHHASVMKKYSRDSILSRVSQLLYRIKDKVERANVATQVYRFLAGYSKRPPATPIKQMNELLSSELAERYNTACGLVKKGHDIGRVSRQLSVDWFEISYCIRKTTTDPTILELVTFKDDS